MTIAIKEAKAQAGVLRRFLSREGIAVSQAMALEAVARLAHQKNWATLVAQDKLASQLLRKEAEVKDWPVFVLYFDEDEDTLEEALRVLPPGATLDNRWLGKYQTVDTSAGVVAPDGFYLDPRVVVRAVHSQVPSVSKYGLPPYADENGDIARTWFHEELGCATLDSLSLTLRDTRDDSAERYWFEAYIEPTYARQLEALF